jgi:hypothetical protein
MEDRRAAIVAVAIVLLASSMAEVAYAQPAATICTIPWASTQGFAAKVRSEPRANRAPWDGPATGHHQC